MSLEAALKEHTELLREHNDLLRQVLGASGKKVAPSKTDEDGDAAKPAKKAAAKKDTKAKADDDGDGDGVTFDALKSALQGWLGEFKANEKDPETDARKEALAKQFGRMGVEKLPEIDGDQDKLNELHEWLENKAKKIDREFGKGRLTEKPKAGKADADDDI